MIEAVQSILLLVLIILQIILMIYLLYTTHKRFKEDTEFWKKQESISDEFLKQLQEQPTGMCAGTYAPDEKVTVKIEGVTNEQEDESKE